MEWRVTYSKDAHKKTRNRKWLDGLFKIDEAGGRFSLNTEEGEHIAADVVPNGAGELAEGNELEWLIKSNNIIVVLGELLVPGGAQQQPLQSVQPNSTATSLPRLPKPRPLSNTGANLPLPASKRFKPAGQVLPQPPPASAAAVPQPQQQHEALINGPTAINSTSAAGQASFQRSRLGRRPGMGLARPVQERSANEIMNLLNISLGSAPSNAAARPNNINGGYGDPKTVVPAAASKAVAQEQKAVAPPAAAGPKTGWSNFTSSAQPLPINPPRAAPQSNWQQHPTAHAQQPQQVARSAVDPYRAVFEAVSNVNGSLGPGVTHLPPNHHHKQQQQPLPKFNDTSRSNMPNSMHMPANTNNRVMPKAGGLGNASAASGGGGPNTYPRPNNNNNNSSNYNSIVSGHPGAKSFSRRIPSLAPSSSASASVWNSITAYPTYNPNMNNNNNNGGGAGFNNFHGNDSSMGLILRFPSSLEQCTRLHRLVEIPTGFSSIPEYIGVWRAALSEEISLRVAETAAGFYTAMAKAGPGVVVVNGGGRDIKQLEEHLRKCGVQYYGDCELFMWKNYNNKNAGGVGGYQKVGKGRKRKQQQEEEEEEEGERKTKAETFYLTLKSGRSKTSQYRKHDLWLISNHRQLQSGYAPGQPGDRSKAPWVAAVRSLWHGPNKDGKFEVEFVTSVPSGLIKTQPVYALKGPDVSMELSLIDLLHFDILCKLPLMPSLLGISPLREKSGAVAVGAPQQAEQQEEGRREDIRDAEAEEMIQRFKLNEEQAQVVHNVATWCNTSKKHPTTTAAGPAGATGSPPLDVCLIHGPFGSGKSTLLVALLRLILTKRANPDSPVANTRILISAHTNVAVDRVLEGLLDSGCSEFLRVGSVRRVSRRLLGQSLHASESSGAPSAAAELRDLLKEASDPHERAVIQAELAAAEQGADRQRKRLLKSVPVVGVTCCSASLPVLEDQSFDIVILDECSQIIEPLSLAPILQARCRFLVAAGDPLQLPPVIASPSTLSSSSAFTAGDGKKGGGVEKAGMLRPLFTRLATALYRPPYFLRQQYRCHPSIAAISNAAFYSGRLVDGCSAEDKPSLLPALPNLVFLDVRGQEQYSGRSVCNPQEANAVVNIVKQLLSLGITPSQIGVICFYRAQVYLVQNQLKRLAMPPPAAAPLPAAVDNLEPTAAVVAPKKKVVEVSDDEKYTGKEEQQQQTEDPHEEQDGKEPNDQSRITDIDNININENEVTMNEPDPQPPAQTPASIQVATVDAFQGAERDIIILTTATTNPGAFASDGCRLNVALTRGKHNLIVVGCGPALQRAGQVFGAVMKAAQEGGGMAAGGALPIVLKRGP